jgi:hypothetical protein
LIHPRIHSLSYLDLEYIDDAIVAYWLDRGIAPLPGQYETDFQVKRVQIGFNRRFARVEPNSRGRFPISLLDVELGVWQGVYGQFEAPWLRWRCYASSHI